MKFVHIARLILLLVLFSATLSDGDKTQQGQQQQGQQEPPKIFECNRDILRSYMLRGRDQSNTEKMLLCPAIKSNCCTKLDQQRIYHIVNDILPPRLIEYQSKIKMALTKLRNLHKHVVKANPVFTGSMKRRSFCSQQARKVYNFPFAQLHSTIIDELELTHDENKEHYEKFFCVLCDGENHPFMEFSSKTPKVSFDVDYCKEFLHKRSDILKLLNIELVDYLVTLQNVVDCTHYVKSYNLNFFDTQKVAASKETTACLNYMNGKNFLKYCQPVCERIKFSKITEMVDGDYEFIIDAVNLFEKFFQFKETGNFISMKLRLFFKKFVIPRTLTKNKRAKFLDKLRIQQEDEAFRKKNKQDKKLMKENTGENKGKKARKLVLTRRHQDDKKITKKNASRERHLMLTDDIGTDSFKSKLPEQTQHIFKLQSDASSVNPDAHLNLGRVLASRSYLPRKLNEKEQKQGENQKPGEAKLPKKKLHAKLIFDQELQKFYDEISLVKPDDQFNHIFRIQKDPIDFDRYQKVWANDSGIHPDRYQDLKFEMDKEAFYKLLFQFRKPDQVDPSLAFFLADFTPGFMKDIKIDLRTDFKIDPKNFVIGKQRKQKSERVLAANPERVLIEDYAHKTIFGDTRIHH